MNLEFLGQFKKVQRCKGAKGVDKWTNGCFKLIMCYERICIY